MRKINVMLPCCFSAIASCIMLQQHVVFLVLQLRAVEPAVANPAVRSWQPQGPQLENGVFIVVRLHLSCCFSTKKNKESTVFVWENVKIKPGTRNKIYAKAYFCDGTSKTAQESYLSE